MRGNEIADRLARSGSGQRFIGPEPFLGAEYKKEDERLDEEPASDIVARSLQYTEVGSIVNLWPQSGYRGPIIVL